MNNAYELPGLQRFERHIARTCKGNRIYRIVYR